MTRTAELPMSPEQEAFFAGMICGIFLKTHQIGQELPVLDPAIDEALKNLVMRVTARFDSSR